MANKKTEKIERKLYNDTVDLTFYPTSHRYKVDGVWIPSVTSITGQIDKSSALMRWAKGETEKVLLPFKDEPLTEMLIQSAVEAADTAKNHAASIGNEVHNYCELHVNALMNGTQLPNIEDYDKDENVFNGILAFLKWISDNDVKFTASEQLLYSKEHLYVGTTDFLYTRGDEKHEILHLGDFKTSKGVYMDQFIQMAGYEMAYEEEFGVELGYGTLLKLDKETGEYKEYNTIKEFDDISRKLFMTLLNLRFELKDGEKQFRKLFKHLVK